MRKLWKATEAYVTFTRQESTCSQLYGMTKSWRWSIPYWLALDTCLQLSAIKSKRVRISAIASQETFNVQHFKCRIWINIAYRKIIYFKLQMWPKRKAFTWRTLYMQAFRPPEKDAKTTGHGLIFSSLKSNGSSYEDNL